MKRIRIAALVVTMALCAAFVVSAQQITRVAVLDVQRVIDSFSKDTAPLRDFDQKKAQVQAEIDQRVAEIKDLQAQRAAAQDTAAHTSLDALIAQKTADLKNYARDRQAELDLMVQALGTGSTFLQKLNQQIRAVAESEGYSLVLNAKSGDASNSVLWYSSSVDITDKVIQALTIAR